MQCSQGKTASTTSDAPVAVGFPKRVAGRLKCGRSANPKPLGGGMARQPAFEGGNYPKSQVRRQRLPHHRWPPSSSKGESDVSRVAEDFATRDARKSLV
jgi:hypothetical protein